MYLAVFDIDGVLYNGHTIFDIIKKQEQEDFIPSGTWKLIEQALIEYKSGKVSYKVAADTMLDVYLSALKGKTKESAREYLVNFMEQNSSNFYPYFKEILPELKKTHDVYLLTTNLQTTAEVLVERFGLKGSLSTEEEVIDGVYTGKIIRSLAGNKHVITELLAQYPYEKSIAIGDSENDISMLTEVSNPLAMDPDRGLQAYATEHQWTIITPETAASAIRKIVAEK